MPTLKIFVGEHLAKEFDLEQIAMVGILDSPAALVSMGKVLLETPPNNYVSVFKVEEKDGDEFWFYDTNGPVFSKYSLEVSRAIHDKEDYILYFPEKYNPRYTTE